MAPRQHTGMNMNHISPESDARREGARQADGKFGAQEHVEQAAGTAALTSDKTKAFIEHMIANGTFSPAARDMDVRDVIEQHCEANVETFERKAAMYDAADVLMRGKYTDLVSGDLVDLEPLIEQYHERDGEYFESNLMAAECELAEVDTVTLDAPHLGTAVIWNFQTNIAVPVDADIEYRPNMEVRCNKCGADTTDNVGGGYGPLMCVDCAVDENGEQEGHGLRCVRDELGQDEDDAPWCESCGVERTDLIDGEQYATLCEGCPDEFYGIHQAEPKTDSGLVAIAASTDQEAPPRTQEQETARTYKCYICGVVLDSAGQHADHSYRYHAANYNNWD